MHLSSVQQWFSRSWCIVGLRDGWTLGRAGRKVCTGNCAVCSVMCAVCSGKASVCSIQFAVRSVNCAVCSVQWAVCSGQYAVGVVQCAMRSLECAVCSVQCSVCRVQGSVCSRVFLLVPTLERGRKASTERGGREGCTAQVGIQVLLLFNC